MNCANHADASAVAYCRTCGKPLCGNCTRPVRGVIYCENCIGARMEAPPQPTVYQQIMDQGMGLKVPPLPPSGSGPNPTVAGILAGFFPFGVGAVYTGQYAKGLAHLAIFVLLVAGCNAADNGHSDALGVICGLGLAFFYVYQIIDSVRSARAIQMAQPVPDPFGLAATFGGGTKIETSKVPMGAIVLILVGVLFLLNTMGLSEFGLSHFWPVILIAVGGWMFARNLGVMGLCCTGCQCARCRARRLMGPAIVTTIGILFLLQNLRWDFGFSRTWPVILLVVGAIKLLQNSASWEGHVPSSGVAANPPGGTIPPSPIPPVPPIPPGPPAPPTGEASGRSENDSEVNRG
jgi:Domain of unknown function (DUF5668)/B-box zinc finger